MHWQTFSTQKSIYLRLSTYLHVRENIFIVCRFHALGKISNHLRKLFCRHNQRVRNIQRKVDKSLKRQWKTQDAMRQIPTSASLLVQPKVYHLRNFFICYSYTFVYDCSIIHFSVLKGRKHEILVFMNKVRKSFNLS